VQRPYIHAMSISRRVRALDTTVFRVPRAYFYDRDRWLEVLRARSSRKSAEDGSSSPEPSQTAGEWRCARCGEPCPGTLETCWNCDGTRE